MCSDVLFTKKEWEEEVPKVVNEMVNFIRPYRAAVFENCGDHGRGHGSGSYISINQKIYILTNEHVAELRERGKELIYQFDGQDDLRKIVGDDVSLAHPFDLALLPIDNRAWINSKHSSKAIELEKIDLCHSPVEGELLTFTGFAGENVNFSFGTLLSEATCSTAREVSVIENDQFDPNFHFGVNYRPDLATRVVGDKDLPIPKGFSGSAIWNTRFVEAKMRGIPWSSDLALVTGVIWGWPSEEACLIATRSEYLRSFLLTI